MRSTRFRLFAFALIATGLGSGLLLQPRPTAAQPVPVDPLPPKKDPKKPDEEKLEKISFPENKQTNELFRGLLEYADPSLPEKNYKNLFRVAQIILDAKSDYFYLYTDGSDKGERRSVKEETNRIIGGLPKAGLEYYQSFYGPDAENLLKAAKDQGYDRPLLAEIAQRYYHTKAGAEAARLLAAISLESGNYPEAAYSYRRLLARPDADAILDPRALFRAAVALRRASDGKQTEEVAGVWDKFEKKFPREGLQVGKKVYSVEQLKGELDRPVAALFGGSVDDAFVSGRGGNNTRTATAVAGVPFLQYEFQLPVLYTLGLEEQDKANAEVRKIIDAAYANVAYKGKKTPLVPSFFPVTAPNMIIFRGYDGVYAFYSKDCKDSTGRVRAVGELAWYTDAKWGSAHLFRGAPSGGDEATLLTQDKTNQEQWNQTWVNTLPGVLFENPLAGTLSHDGKRVYFVDDFNIPPPVNQFDPNMGFNPGAMQQAQGGKVEYNRLVAVDLETGNLAWRLGELAAGSVRDDEDKIASASQLGEGSYFLGPPVTVNGKLYALLERDGALKLACFDPSKESAVVKANAKPGRQVSPATRQPELVWVQNLGRANTPIKQDPGRRFQGCFLATADGVMVCPTNSGAVVAVDLNARSLLWAHTYASLDAPANPQPGRFNPGMGAAGGLKDQRWRASAPMIAGGRVLFTAYDGSKLQCLDLRTGKLKWEETRKADDLYVGGVAGDKVLVVGRTGVRAYKIVGDKVEGSPDREKSVPAWENDARIATPVGHGVVGKDGMFYLPVIGDPDKPDDKTPVVMGINTTDGKTASTTPYRRKDSAGPTAGDPRQTLGNLVFHDGLMFSQSATEVMWFQLNEVKQREAQVALERNPNDPVGLLWNGELKLEAGKLDEAIALFKKSEANKPDEPTVRKLKNKLYDAYTARIRTEADFAKVEDILVEYKGLCEFPLDKDDPVNYPRQLEEQIRRRGLYYNLVADGREKQGRLTDAFDAYRSYAGLGERNKMLPVPEDTNTLALPEVWAAGRIDAMMRKAKDPAARKPLEDKVSKEWDEVKGANDLPRLRAFVKAFGPYFQNGRDAQFLLADKLTATNDDANRREAQDLLLNLVAQSDDDRDAPTAARATDALARVLTDRGLTDDALGLYRRIAERFPTSAVREGKTGADLLGELIADKRYLPSLEADRPPAVGRYKVDAAQATNYTRQPMSSVGLVTDGGAMSFYKRNRVTLDFDVQGQGTASVVVTDRVTNKEKLKTEGVPVQFYNYNTGSANPNGGLPNQKLAQVSGHMLLLHTFGPTGTWVQCFDLSTGNKKPLWKVNLHGTTGVSAQGAINNWQQESDPSTGDMTVTPIMYNNQTGQQTQDWSFKLGRSMVLQPNYATVLTKDGMSTRDPRTGSVLWQRAGVAMKSMIFGDARHVFLVEPTANSSTTRVFRAVDGVQLPKVPDFGDMVMSRKEFTRLHIIGRTILVVESAGKDKPKVLRLYDCLEGKDVWSKEYPADSAALESIDPEVTGMVTADGKIDILSSRTGTPLHQVSADAKKVDEHVKDKGKFSVVKPLLMADADRFYVFLNRATNLGVQQPEQMGQPSLTRVRGVNGVAYAFDRGSGKRLWYMETEFQNQRLIVERFDDLPCLLVANPMYYQDPNAPGGKVNNGQPVHKIAAIDKANGAVREMKDLQYNGNWLMGLHQDEKTGAWEFGNANNQQRVVITPLAATAPK